jgi:hypothetical protein
LLYNIIRNTNKITWHYILQNYSGQCSFFRTGPQLKYVWDGQPGSRAQLSGPQGGGQPHGFRGQLFPASGKKGRFPGPAVRPPGRWPAPREVASPMGSVGSYFQPQVKRGGSRAQLSGPQGGGQPYGFCGQLFPASGKKGRFQGPAVRPPGRWPAPWLLWAAISSLR